MSGATSRRKGKAGELELAAELRRIGYPDARRGQQFSGVEGRDVIGIPGVHIECKRQESGLSVYKAISQAVRDCDSGEVPIVAHRRNRGAWLVVLHLDHAVSFAIRVLRGLGYTVVPPGGCDG